MINERRTKSLNVGETERATGILATEEPHPNSTGASATGLQPPVAMCERLTLWFFQGKLKTWIFTWKYSTVWCWRVIRIFWNILPAEQNTHNLMSSLILPNPFILYLGKWWARVGKMTCQWSCNKSVTKLSWEPRTLSWQSPTCCFQVIYEWIPFTLAYSCACISLMPRKF